MGCNNCISSNNISKIENNSTINKHSHSVRDRNSNRNRGRNGSSNSDRIVDIDTGRISNSCSKGNGEQNRNSNSKSYNSMHSLSKSGSNIYIISSSNDTTTSDSNSRPVCGAIITVKVIHMAVVVVTDRDSTRCSTRYNNTNIMKIKLMNGIEAATAIVIVIINLS